jgi:hypothetical protein
MFGSEQNIAVMLIKETPELMNLYETIHAWLVHSSTRFDTPEYEATGYLPHSTFQNTGSLIPGEKRLVRSISIVDLFPNNDGHRRKIAKTIALS